MAGQVRVGTERILKPSYLLTEDAELNVTESMKYVGRGGLKMENFLGDSGFKVDGMHIFDIGASTGGFTDCLLQKVPLERPVLMWGMDSYITACVLITELAITKKLISVT